MTTILPAVHRRSALEAFSCPKRYKAIYIDGVPDESDPARRGSAFHAAAKGYAQRLIAAKQSADLELATAALQAALVESMTPPHLMAEVSSLFWRWAERFELDLDAVLLVEERQQDAEGHTWQPDLVYAFDDVLEVRDYKTHYQAFTEAQAKAEFQARWYIWQARKLWPGFAKYRIVFEFIRWNVEVSAEFDQAEIDQTENEVLAVVGAIKEAARRDEWPAQPGAQCTYCSLICPVADHMDRMPVRILTRESAQQAAGMKLVLDQARAQLDDALRGWCQEHGPVVVGGMEFAHRPTEKKTFPIKPVLDILDVNGITPAFDVSASTLRPYLATKRYAFLRPDLELLATLKPGSKFSAKKVGAVGDDETSEEG